MHVSGRQALIHLSVSVPIRVMPIRNQRAHHLLQVLLPLDPQSSLA